MKKNLLLALMLGAFALTSCNDDDSVTLVPGTYPDLMMYATTHIVGETDSVDDESDDEDEDDDDTKYYFETDAGKKIFMTYNALMADYDFTQGERVIIYVAMIEDYSEEGSEKLEGAAYGCDYGMRLFGIRKVYTTEDKTVTTTEEEEALADHAISYVYNSLSYSGNYINLIAGIRADNLENIHLYLVDNQAVDPAETKEGYLNLELRYDRGTDEAVGSTYDEYISIDIEKYAEQLKDMEGIMLRIFTLNSGTQYIKIGLTDADEDADSKVITKTANIEKL